MPTLPAPYLNFSGGLNTKAAANDLPDSQSPDLLNVQGTVTGAVTTRPGVGTLASIGPGTPTALYAAELPATSVLLSVVNGILGSTDVLGASTVLNSGMGTADWAFVTASPVSGQGPVFGVNGTQTPKQWTGSGAATAWVKATGGVAVPNGKYLAYHKDQVFMAGTTAFPAGLSGPSDPLSTVYWSAIGDPTNWDPASLTGAGWTEFDPGDGQAISALGIVGPYLLVAKPRKLWILVNPATAASRMMSDSIGVSAQRTIASGPEGTFFMSQDRGVFLTNGSTLTPLSDQILPSLQFLTGPAVYFQQHYYVVSTPYLYDFDTVLKSWWRHQLPAVPKFLTQWHPPGIDGLYSMSPQSGQGFIHRIFDPALSTDAGGSLTWHWYSPWQSPSFFRRRLFHTGYYRKRLRQVRVNGYGTVALSVAYNVNPSNLRSVSADVFAGASIPTWARFNNLGVANDFQLQFSGASTLPGSVSGYALMLTDRKDSMT